MKTNSPVNTNKSSNAVINCLRSKEIKCDTKNNIIPLKTTHDCSQSDCQAYDSTSTDSDIEKRIRIKATRFSRAYPKRCISNKLCASATDVDENVLTNSNKSDKDGSNTKNITNLCHQQSKYINYIPRKSVEERLNHFTSTQSCNTTHSQRSYSNYIEMFSSYDDSSSEESTAKLSEDSLCLDSQDLYSLSRTEKIKSDTSIKNFEDTSKTSNTYHKICTLKSTRPFKSYPGDPLALTVGFDTARICISSGRPETYNDFRKRMLGNRHMNKSGINMNMRRFQTYTTDKSYREKRNKNNIAAKRSRDARRAKEDELAIRCAYLEQENMYLKRKVAEMEQERRRSNIS